MDRLNKTRQMIFLIVALTWGYIIVKLPMNLQSWWAFSFYKHVPVQLRYILAIIPLIILSLGYLDILYLRKNILNQISKTNVLIVILVSIPTIWALREHTIWGDGLQIVAILEGRDMPWNAPYNWCWHEPLTWLITVGWYHLGNALIHWNGITAIQTLNALLGALTIGALWRAAKIFSKSAREAVLLFLFALSAGATQVLLAHVENYTLVTLLSVITLTTFFNLKNVTTSSVLISSISSGAAVSSHLGAVLIVSLPWAYIQLRLIAKRKIILLLLSIIAFLIPISLTFAIAKTYGADIKTLIFNQHHLVTSYREILHIRYLRSVINTFIVTSLPIIMLIPVVLTAPTSIASRVKHSPLQTLSLLPILLSFIVLKSTIPRPIDWDVFAPLGMSLMLVIESMILKSGHTKKTERMLWGVVALSYSFALPWIWTNASLTRIWPDPLAIHRDIPYVKYDLLELFPKAEIRHPTKPLCPEGVPSKCKYVYITKFGYKSPIGFLEYPVLFDHPPASIQYKLHLPKSHYFFWSMLALDPIARNWPGDGVTFIVRVKGDQTPPRTWTKYIPKSVDGWEQFSIDLTPFSGQDIVITLTTSPGPRGDFRGDRAGWGVPRIMKGVFEGTYQSLWGY